MRSRSGYVPPPRRHFKHRAPLTLEEAHARQRAHRAVQTALLDAIAFVARTQRFFTADDVWIRLASEGHCGEYDKRHLGAALRDRSRATPATITPTTEYTPSSRRECHNRPVRVWKSLVYLPDSPGQSESDLLDRSDCPPHPSVDAPLPTSRLVVSHIDRERV